MAKTKTMLAMCLEDAKEKKKLVREEVKALASMKDSTEKFEKLIDITTKYEKYLKQLNKKLSTELKPGLVSLTSATWKTKYKEYKKKIKVKEAKTKPVKHVVEDGYYNIMLCWSIKPNYCLCESIIEKIRKYFDSIKVPAVDLTKTEFPDRTEFCETYKLRCSKEKYDLILNSADYLLHILADSTYDKCNIGIFGRSF